MPKLKKVSAYLTEIFLFKIMNKLSEDGVNMQEGKLVRYKSFVSANECNTGQRSFLQSRTVWGRGKMQIHGCQYPPTLHTNQNERILKI